MPHRATVSGLTRCKMVPIHFGNFAAELHAHARGTVSVNPELMDELDRVVGEIELLSTE
jgi:hypothetical protein